MSPERRAHHAQAMADIEATTEDPHVLAIAQAVRELTEEGLPPSPLTSVRGHLADKTTRICQACGVNVDDDKRARCPHEPPRES